jgi:hypothetical protein
MAPARALAPLAPTTPLSLIIPRLVADHRYEPTPLPVVEAGRLIGLIDRDELVELLALEDSFGVLPRGAPG